MKLQKLFSVLCGALIGAGVVHAGTDEWSEFRGPGGVGMVQGAPELPLTWSETENVVWKTEIPNIGWSTPVVLGGQLWLSSATEDGHDFYAYCVDAKTGKILFEKHLFHCDNPEPLGNSVNCYASPSAVTESGRVYLHFGSYGTACLDAKTAKVLWKRDDMPCRHYRGPGSSAIIHEDLLILTFDGVDQQYITGLDKKTGKTVWRTDRSTEWTDLDESGKPKREGDFRKAFTTPIVIEAAGKTQLISPASSCIFAYNPKTGREIWKLPTPGHSASVSAVFGKELVLATTGNGKAEMLGIRPDGKGEVGESHVVWRFGGEDVPTTPSPVVVGDLLFMVSNRGTLNCLEVETGKTVWRERVGGNYIASPIVCGDRIYFFGNTGKITVIRVGRTFEQLAENKLDAGFMASPTVIGNSLVLRTKTHLYCIKDQ